ncbi:MAG: MoxR family ATPase [Proteobacteria bacterium]|nr:MoxR family ATPase [Pseudomonadota bacterium]
MASNQTNKIFDSIDSVHAAFAEENYITDRALALTLKLAADLEKPILLEGEAGVGKTEVAKVLASVLDTPLIRLQCYEGLDANTTLYEWNYARQILHIRMAEQDSDKRATLEQTIFSDEFLLNRPLLEAIRHPGPEAAVLLIDEVDRADEEFEAFLLEVLSEFQITVPEIGTFSAIKRPRVILTSNRTRELNDALKRRCLYLWIDYPTPEKELEIITARIPGIQASLAKSITEVMRQLREVDFYKRPGIAEALDWSQALLGLGANTLTPELMQDTAGVILKYHDDIERLREIGADTFLNPQP